MTSFTLGGFMAFNVSFNNISVISWQSVLLVEGTRENHQPVASHWQTLSHNVVSSTLHHEWGFELTTLVVIGTDCTGCCKSNYHTIMTKTVPVYFGQSGRTLQLTLDWNTCMLNSNNDKLYFWREVGVDV